MEWLNKVDDALDWVLGPVQPEEGDDSASDVGASTVATAANAAAAGSANGDGLGDGRAAFVSESTTARHKINVDRGAVEAGKQHGNMAAVDSAASKLRLPPPPLQLQSATPSPTERPTSALSPPDTSCPSTPLVARTEEFLVIDESPNLESNMSKIDYCENGSHCRPPKEADATIKEEEEAFIKREAEATIQHQQESETTMQKTQNPVLEQMKQSEEIISGGGTPANVTMESDHTPLISQMQNFARASPAPTKVTIGDRERGPFASHDNALFNQNRTWDRRDAATTTMPPPPLILHTSSIERLEHSRGEQVDDNGTISMEGPPSPSKMIIHLSTQKPSSPGSSTTNSQNRHHPNLPISPPPLASATNSSWSTSTANPKRVRPHARVPRSAGRTPRATPGVIRRRIREPSLSPPESPRPSSEVDIADRKALGVGTRSKPTSIPPPPPPLPPPTPSGAPVANGKEEITSGLRIPPPPLGAPTASPPESSRQSPIIDVAKIDSSIPTQRPPPPPPPPVDNVKDIPTPSTPSPPSNHATPVIDNRKVLGDPCVASMEPATLPSLNSSEGKSLDLVIGPLQVADKTDDARFDTDDEKMEEDVNGDDPPHENAEEEISPPMNQVEKAMDWVLGPVKVQTPQTLDSSANTDKDANRESSNRGEHISDTITDWFKRMGSKEEGEQETFDSNSDDGASSVSYHSQVSNDSELTDELDDFAIPSPKLDQAQDDQWDPSLNRYGFFHVRLLRAQRLPCESESSVHSTLSLQPWKGKIRIPVYTTIDGPGGAGVCLRWDKPPDKRKGGSKSKSSGSKDGESLEDPCSHSMVHAYNNIDTPVPAILLELSVSSLGGVFDRFLCSVSVPCHDLLRNPRIWTHRWYPANVKMQGDQTIDEEGSDAETAPLILLEACFEPKVSRATVSTLSKQVILDQDTYDEHEPIISEDSDTLGSIPHIIRPDRHLRTMPDSVYSSTEDDSISKTSSLSPALVPRNPVTKSHLLRVRSFWTPTWCAVCSMNITTSWMQGKHFECEACHIFCCRDCQLQVDACIPCGSELAAIAVKKAEQYSVPSLGHVMTTLAPYLDSTNAVGTTLGVGNEEKDTAGQSDNRSNLNTLHHLDGIGVMNIRVHQATIFDKTYPAEAEPDQIFQSQSNLRNGDHYVRVSWLGSKESKRTKTVLQTSKPLFDSEEMVFDVPHYAQEYKLEVIDANSDKPVGSCLLSANMILQWQRDDTFANKGRLLLSFFHLRKFTDSRRVKLVLRTGVKDGFGLSFYSSSAAGGPKGKETSRPGEICGWLEFDVHLEEDRQLFYSTNPRQCPPKPREEFDIALIQLHIARIGELLDGIRKLVSTYMFVVSWENAKLTGASMMIFVVLVLGYNIEYLGALPIGSLVLYMLYLGYLRISGRFKDRWTLREKHLLIKSETDMERNISFFRPVGLLRVGNLKGKHLKSRELGLPGSFYTSVLYDPLRYAHDERQKSSLVNIDTLSGCLHEICTTVSPGITSNPTWTHIQESPELMRLKHLLPDDRMWRQGKEAEESSLSYPILQPLYATDDYSFDHKEIDESQCRDGLQLMPFESSLGAVVFQVRYSDVLGSFQMFDNVLGEVVIPLAKLALSGRAVEGWFRLLQVGAKETVPGESDDSSMKSGSMSESIDGEDDVVNQTPDFPELYLKVQFSSDGDILNKTFQSDMEASKVICEALSRTASIAQENSGVGVIGSSLNTINTVRTLGGKLQNQISVLVDMLERVRNAFNFSNPRITVFILLALTLLWIVLALIPTRIVVLIAGLAQYGATFYTRFIKKNVRKESPEDKLDSTSNGSPIENLFLSIPTDEDLRRTYFWEARRLGEKEREKFAVAKRQGRLEKLWKAHWHGALGLKEKKTGHTSTPSSSGNWNWGSMFGLLEGHRFIWWRSEKHFDTGEAPLGQIFFAGHSGLAGLSPLDLRELSNEEIPFVVSIFGRGPQGQQKITVLAPSSDVKDSLENAVLAASMKAD